MPISTGTVRALPGGAANPLIRNVSVPLANTEVSQALGTNVTQVLIRVRGRANLRIAFVSTETGTNYITVPRDSALTLTGITFNGTIYLRTDKAAQTVEILEWS